MADIMRVDSVLGDYNVVDGRNHFQNGCGTRGNGWDFSASQLIPAPSETDHYQDVSFSYLGSYVDPGLHHADWFRSPSPELHGMTSPSFPTNITSENGQNEQQGQEDQRNQIHRDGDEEVPEEEAPGDDDMDEDMGVEFDVDRDDDDSDSDYQELNTPDSSPFAVVKVESQAPADKGCSFGARSSKPIRNLRAQAEAGDVQSAIKLGWAAHRIRDMHNENRRKRGEVVALNEEIDDLSILQQISERQEKNRLHQKKRADNMKLRAAMGDDDVAFKLGWSLKRIEQVRMEREQNGGKMLSIEPGQPKNTKKSKSKPGVDDTVYDAVSSNFNFGKAAKASKSAAASGHKPEDSSDMIVNVNHDKGPSPYPMPTSAATNEFTLRMQYEWAKEECEAAQKTALEANRRLEVAKAAVADLQNSLDMLKAAIQKAPPGKRPKGKGKARIQGAKAAQGKITKGKEKKESNTPRVRPSNFPRPGKEAAEGSRYNSPDSADLDCR